MCVLLIDWDARCFIIYSGEIITVHLRCYSKAILINHVINFSCIAYFFNIMRAIFTRILALLFFIAFVPS